MLKHVLASAIGTFVMSAAVAEDAAPVAQPVTFVVSGDPVVGTLYRPADVAPDARLPAIVVQGPWTQVKEQVGRAYGERLAAQGFAVLAFDNRHWGESGGQPRSLESPRAKIDDLKGAVDFLSAARGVDADRIYGLGVCFGAGYVAALASEEPRVKGIATVAAWLHDRPSLAATYGADGLALRERTGEEALTRYRADGTVIRIPAFSNDVPLAAMMGPLDYYASPARGAIPAWNNDFAAMSFVEWIDFDSVSLAARIPQPVMMIHSDGSALPDNVRRFYAQLPDPRKELEWTTGAHLDFYDRPALVEPAVRRVAAFFNSLAAR